MALSSLFKPGTRSLLERIEARDYADADEKRDLYARLARAAEVKTADAVRLLFSPDGELRRAVATLLGSRRDPDTVRHFTAALSGRPEPARRAALAELAALPLGNLAQQIGALLDQAEPATRKLAAEAILDLPASPQASALLRRIAESGEAVHRVKAVTRLAAAATAADLSWLERLAEDPDERVRIPIYQAVTRLAEPRHLDLLLRRLPEEAYAVQQLLIQALCRLLPGAGPEAVEPVLGLLASGSTGLRSAALKVLLALPDRAATVRRFTAYSMQLLGWVRDRALQSMREFGADVLEPALDLLADADPEVRSAALTLLSGFDDPRVSRAAAGLLADPDWWIAINAADLLGRSRDGKATPALIAALERDEVRWAAIDALGRIGGPAAVSAISALTRDPRVEIRIEALTALAGCADPRVPAELERAAGSDPAKWVRARAAELMRRGSLPGGPAPAGAARVSEIGAGAPPIHRLLAEARLAGASDLHVSVGTPPTLRVHGVMRRLDVAALGADATEALLLPLLEPGQRARLDREHQLDACFFVDNDGRYRASLFLDRLGLNGVFRVIPDQPPTITDLGLPADLAEIATYHQGIVVVTGPAGCGKSTTLAAFVNLFNETRRAHVLSLEDPVEFVHPFKNCLINQREVGRHSASYARALRAALREDPDVIVIGELRDAETVSLALTAAETGHVVLTTLNAPTAAKAVDRILNSVPHDQQPQARESLSGSLKLVIAQHLVEAAGGGRVGCFEILRATHGVTALIRDAKTYQIPSLMQIGQSQGMRRFDDALLALVREGKISAETAYLRAAAKETFEPLVSPRFLEETLA